MEWLLVLLSEVCRRTTRRLRNARTRVSKRTHTHTRRMQQPPLTQSTAVVFYSTRIMLSKNRFGLALPCFFSPLLSPLSPSCFAVKAEFGSERLLHLNCCPGRETNKHDIAFHSPQTQTCQKHHRGQDAGLMDGRMWAAGSHRGGEQLKPTCACVRALATYMRANQSWA